MTVEGVTVVNTETRTAIFLINNGDGTTPGTGPFFYLPHSSMSWLHLSMTAGVRGVERCGARSTTRVSVGRGNVASAVVQRLTLKWRAKTRAMFRAQREDCVSLDTAERGIFKRSGKWAFQFVFRVVDFSE